MKEIHVSTEMLQLFSAREAWEYQLVPCETKGDTLCCYGESGRNYESVVTELEVLTGKKIVVNSLDRELFSRLIKQSYRNEGKAVERERLKRKPASGNPGFLQGLIEEAYREYASDIHLEPDKERCRVRFRLDGKLVERYVIEKGNYAALVNQVKILANLDISEKRLPQDGRILYEQGEDKFDVRVSSLPTIHGEKVVMRLLTRHVELLELENLGFSRKQLEDYLVSVRKPHGLVLISGPTGSGKSTTLYATLRLLNEVTSNILTIEDPVEYTLQGINQVQLKEEIGLTFTAALRTFLRQDPDIIMLGEIRDTDTAQMAIRSSLTGHLIFSTIHTNSAWGSVSRLVDMGVHPYLIADTLILCVAQRLVRLLCPCCKQEIEAGAVSGRISTVHRLKSLFKPVGCEQCYYTGYRGRKAIYEVIPVDEELSGAIRREESDIGKYLRERNIRTLSDSALELLETGQTSLEEVLTLINS
ncbi:GspE/PulE family protein [uncultured Sanguibacteroides sp.]|uniref:GspE/PulE family protein n=1 Tax=uncultured Sanguibacteroides sp. TaxID=1635151 RepID=UPI0025D43A7B|nr:GspE/PulE family protein [uncultured Sanguibacteroides sp.]